MGLNILENGLCIADESNPNQKYKAGQSLVELAECNLDNLYNLLHTEISADMTFENYFSRLFEIDCKSIFFTLLKNTLSVFYGNYEECLLEPQAKQFPHTPINETAEFKQNMISFFSPLFDAQRKVRQILVSLSSANENTKINKLKQLLERNPSLFKLQISEKNSVFCMYDTLFSDSPILLNGEITFKTHFSDIESLYTYELKRLLLSKTKVILCPVCKKLYIAHDIRQKYCSNTCKNEANRGKSNNNIFWQIYRRNYRRLYNSYSVKNSGASLDIFNNVIKIELKKLYNEYKNKDSNDASIIDIYEKKLKAIR